MGVNIIASAIGGGDRRDGPIDFPHFRAERLDPHDRTRRQAGIGFRALADRHIMAAPVHAIDDQIMAIGMLVGEPACQHAGDQRAGIGCGRIVDRLIGLRPLTAAVLAALRLVDEL